METKSKSQEVGLQLSRGPARTANLLADPDTTLRDEEARMLNIRPITVCVSFTCEDVVVVSFFHTHQTCRELQQLTTTSKRFSSMLVVRLLVLDPICLLLVTQSCTTSVNPTHILGPNNPCTHDQTKINSYTRSLCTSRLRYAEVVGRVLNSGLWFKTTQHLLRVFSDHVFRDCECSFLFFKRCTQY